MPATSSHQPASRDNVAVKAPAVNTGFLQRACACGQHTIAGAECSDCSENEDSSQRTLNRESTGEHARAVPAIVDQVLQSPGQPLDASTRAWIEPRFQHDFSGVRVHTDALASESAQAVDALAYTVGHDVVFRAAHYAPSTAEGRKLLAHELTHVVQQREGHATAGISSPADASEREASAAGEIVAGGGAFRPTRNAFSSLHRQVPPAAPAVPAAPAAPSLAGVTATRDAFNNAAAPDADNCAPGRPAALGVDGPALGQNGMEMIFRINGAFPAGTEFEITRTRATGLWQQDGGAWARLGGNAAGTSDDHHDTDECLTPVGGRIFVIDTPGLGGSLNPRGVEFLGAGTVAATATAAVWKLSFAEWVIARNRGLGIGWTRISQPELHRWHSIFSVALGGGGWSRVNAPSGQGNRIRLGAVATTGATP